MAAPLAWRIPMEREGLVGYSPWRHRVGCNWNGSAHTHAPRKKNFSCLTAFELGHQDFPAFRLKLRHQLSWVASGLSHPTYLGICQPS